MSELKCPFCQQELRCDNTWNEVYMCRNPNCKHLLGFGTKELWQELINTRKALDLARHTIGWINQMYEMKIEHTSPIKAKCEFALEQITALEQKNHFANASKKVEQKEQQCKN